MSVLVNDEKENADVLADSTEKPRRGRPPRAKEDLTDMPPESMPEIPKSVASPPRHIKIFDFLEVGDAVQYFEQGDLKLYPMVGLVVAKYEKSRTLDLVVWCREHRHSYGTREGVRHVEDPDTNKYQLKEVGAWREKRTTNLLMDLLESR